ncbi:MAG: hypothetical protein HWQ35_23900 [Nostoc sp. NMS1]|uniref:hypothetical protein n=1 Tax=unclassified Nostoc TaxID=2593658 RepID=UPI0025F7D5B0|nr:MULTISPECIES: hypothetical protein [unclassified Nostoc]MBN3909475.1 hypothetical protein [Nostoc sp. NMS1]MBN3994288.1 hypothetical protein [Nostoc sp. NMS2]
MIISDLNYLENTSEEILGGVLFTATKAVLIGVVINESLNISKSINSNVIATGSAATAEGQANATGNGTVAQVYSFTNTDAYNASANSFSVSATAKP